MGRKCKCAICKNDLTIDTAYKVTDKGKNKYYCSKEEYDIKIKSMEYKDKTYELLKIVLDLDMFEIFPSIANIKLAEIHKGYSWEVIHRTLTKQRKSIQQGINNKNIKQTSGKLLYAIAVIKNCVADEKCNIKVEHNEEYKNTIDIDLLNHSSSITNNKYIKNISDML